MDGYAPGHGSIMAGIICTTLKTVSRDGFEMESKFLTDLDTRTVDDNLQKLLAPLKYQSKLLKRIIEVPKNFITDGASVPRVPVAYMLTGGRAKRAAAVHDYLYQTHLVRSRRQADLAFLEAMELDGVSLWCREVMYAGVRLGGRGSWASGPARYAALQRLQNP